jgi:hypothetical protein
VLPPSKYTTGDTKQVGYSTLDAPKLGQLPSRVIRRYAPLTTHDFSGLRAPDPVFPKNNHVKSSSVYPKTVEKITDIQSLYSSEENHGLDFIQDSEESYVPIDPVAARIAAMMGIVASPDHDPVNFAEEQSLSMFSDFSGDLLAEMDFQQNPQQGSVSGFDSYTNQTSDFSNPRDGSFTPNNQPFTRNQTQNSQASNGEASYSTQHAPRMPQSQSAPNHRSDSSSAISNPEDAKIAISRAEKRIRDKIKQELPPEEPEIVYEQNQKQPNAVVAPSTLSEKGKLEYFHDPGLAPVTMREIQKIQQENVISEAVMRQQITQELKAEADKKILTSQQEAKVQARKDIKRMMKKVVNS